MPTENPEAEVEIEDWVNERGGINTTPLMAHERPRPVNGRTSLLLHAAGVCEYLSEGHLPVADKDHIIRSVGMVIRGALPEVGEE